MGLTGNRGGGGAPSKFVGDGRSPVLGGSQMGETEDKEIDEVLWSGRN
jgi:hypothetical protein